MLTERERAFEGVMRKNIDRPILRIEDELLDDKSGRRLKQYERQIQGLKVRLKKQLDRGLPRQESPPYLALMEACGLASLFLPELWREQRAKKPR